MGVGTILSAKRIFLIAFAEHKAKIIKEAIEGPVSDLVAASFFARTSPI
jgi:glucosamine-6-phosphate deaminase